MGTLQKGFHAGGCSFEGKIRLKRTAEGGLKRWKFEGSLERFHSKKVLSLLRGGAHYGEPPRRESESYRDPEGQF